jgi:hypothetical protein
MFTEKLQGKRVEDSNFDIKKFSVREGLDQLTFIMSLEGRAKDLTEEQCSGFLAAYSSRFFSTDMIMNLWPGLSQEEYKPRGTLQLSLLCMKVTVSLL